MVRLEAERLGFWERITFEPNTGCWLWTGGASTPGPYGKVYLRLFDTKAVVPAHRVAWVIERGEIPPDRTVDHRCFVPLCVNVSHMELVPFAENLRRRRSPKVLRGEAARPEVEDEPPRSAALDAWLAENRPIRDRRDLALRALDRSVGASPGLSPTTEQVLATISKARVIVAAFQADAPDVCGALHDARAHRTADWHARRYLSALLGAEISSMPLSRAAALRLLDEAERLLRPRRRGGWRVTSGPQR